MQRSNHREKSQSQPPLSFEYIYPHGSDPGIRRWQRNGNIWKEEYPSGASVIFKDVHRDMINNIGGSIITKKDGLQIFIPDISKRNLHYLGHYPGKNWCIHFKPVGKDGWCRLGVMKNVKHKSATSTVADHTVAEKKEEKDDWTPIYVNLFAIGAKLASDLYNSYSQQKEKEKLDREEVQRRKEMLQRNEIEKQVQLQKEHEEKLEKENQAKEQANMIAEQKARDKLNHLDENMKKFTSILDILDLTKYKSYKECKRQIKEVRKYDMSDAVKNNLFYKIKEQQMNSRVLTAPKPRFFNTAKILIEDQSKNAEKFSERLSLLQINTKEEFEKFKKDDFYINCPLTDSAKENLFDVYEAGNKKTVNHFI